MLCTMAGVKCKSTREVIGCVHWMGDRYKNLEYVASERLKNEKKHVQTMIFCLSKTGTSKGHFYKAKKGANIWLQSLCGYFPGTVLRFKRKAENGPAVSSRVLCGYSKVRRKIGLRCPRGYFAGTLRVLKGKGGKWPAGSLRVLCGYFAGTQAQIGKMACGVLAGSLRVLCGYFAENVRVPPAESLQCINGVFPEMAL